MTERSKEWLRGLVFELVGHAATLGDAATPKKEGDTDVTFFRPPEQNLGLVLMDIAGDLVIKDIIRNEVGPLDILYILLYMTFIY